MAAFLQDIIENRAIASGGGLLQRLDPRAKTAGLLGLIVVATLVQRPLTLAVALAGALALARLSRVPARRVLAVWSAIPLFTAAIILPATLNVVTPGRPVWTLWSPGGGSFGPWQLPETVAVTDAGLSLALRFLLRSTVCVTLALLLAATTRPDRLFRGLRGLGVPRLFVTLLGMMERYLVVVLRAAQEMHLARRSRDIRPATLRDEQAWVGAGIGSIYRRSQSLANAVYLAMLSRGYTGEAHLLDAPQADVPDYLFLAGCAAAGLALLWLG